MSKRWRYGWFTSDKVRSVWVRIESDGTSHTTTFGLLTGKCSNIVFTAEQAIKVLPPPVGTFIHT